MGRSYSTKSLLTYENMLACLTKEYPYSETNHNTWRKQGTIYFAEMGRENRDGSITGTVYKASANEKTCRPAGSFKVDREGLIVRWPTSDKAMREQAEQNAKKHYQETYEQ